MSAADSPVQPMAAMVAIADVGAEGEKNVQGYVSQIQHYSINDGEGIRTTVFLSGCPLRCRWCANPETWQLDAGALMTAGDVLRETERDRLYYQESGGGVTFSGGEPTAQPEFLHALVEAHRRAGIDTAMESCACFDWDRLAPTLERIDFFFFDIKLMDSAAHKRFTGRGNGVILENIQKAAMLVERAGKEMVIRLPLIKGVNDSAENLRATADFICSNVPGKRLEVLPCHNWAEGKYQALGRAVPSFPEVGEQDCRIAGELLAACGVRLVSYR